MSSNSGKPRTWVADNVDAYRLEEDDLRDYLRRKFPVREYGSGDFKIKVRLS
jgi:hypothetical protein